MSDTTFEPTKEEFLANVSKKIHESKTIFRLLMTALEHIEYAIEHKEIARSATMMKEGNYVITIDPTLNITQVLNDFVINKEDKEMSEHDYMRQAVLEDLGF